jgi:hypothetical protein
MGLMLSFRTHTHTHTHTLSLSLSLDQTDRQQDPLTTCLWGSAHLSLSPDPLSLYSTALDVASWKGEALSVRHLETAIEAHEAFEVDYEGAGLIDNMGSYT